MQDDDFGSKLFDKSIPDLEFSELNIFTFIHFLKVSFQIF